MATDTQRLEWVLSNFPCYDSNWRKGTFWVVFWRESRHYVATGASYRDAIDKAISGDFKPCD